MHVLYNNLQNEDSSRLVSAQTIIDKKKVIICAIIIASRQMGVVEGYDFGAG